MKNWGNWDSSSLEVAIAEAREKGRKSVGIAQEHTDWQNDKAVNEWLDEMGLKYKNEMERTIIYL